jgi:hypothetical protein
MKKVLLAVCLFIGFNAFAQQTAVIHDQNVQLRKVGNFSAIQVSSAIDLYLTQSNENTVAVSAKEASFRDKIITEVVGGTLIIKMASNGWWSWNSWGNIKAKAYVSIKNLEVLSGSGASNIHLVNKIETPKMKLKLSGASDMKGEMVVGSLQIDMSGASDLKGQITAKDIFLEASGASNVELNGVVEDLSVDVSGASDAKLYNLAAKGAVVHASGASTANVNVATLLKADASGASNINYKGEAVLKENKSAGASNIRHRN